MRAFGAWEKFRLAEPSGRIGHSELEFGSMTLMLSDEFPEHGIFGPQPGAAAPFSIHLHVENADAMIERAVMIGHHIEDVSPEEMQRRYTKLLAGG